MANKWRWYLTTAAIFAVAILCLRAFVGLFRVGPASIRSPFPLEQSLGLAFIALALFSNRNRATEQLTTQRPSLLHLCAALTAVAIPFCWNLRDPFLSDDYILVSRVSLDWQTVLWYFTHAGG